ncbi:hypothetical protein ACP26L_23580 [Paenibacillus sp. S-38]|uniref:hypothetical protein n=1 Tax=Paenibacillus sp. S-38 TaxID=3416710 RepID=UPI003CE85849
MEQTLWYGHTEHMYGIDPVRMGMDLLGGGRLRFRVWPELIPDQLWVDKVVPAEPFIIGVTEGIREFWQRLADEQLRMGRNINPEEVFRRLDDLLRMAGSRLRGRGCE